MLYMSQHVNMYNMYTVITAVYIVGDLALTAGHSFVVNFVSELLYTVPASSGLALYYSLVPLSRPNDNHV